MSQAIIFISDFRLVFLDVPKIDGYRVKVKEIKLIKFFYRVSYFIYNLLSKLELVFMLPGVI